MPKIVITWRGREVYVDRETKRQRRLLAEMREIIDRFAAANRDDPPEGGLESRL